ncbi:MAG: hypothetical protein M3327_01735 [Actinomycetota bacterium]|nr:hypothetical protein [Actinomycetota bacterium]
MVDEFYVLMHREYGPGDTFFTRGEAILAMLDALQDEPDMRDELWVERFSLVVAEPSER